MAWTGQAQSSEQFWENHYQGRDDAWGTNPNAVLVDTLSPLELRPGRALDLGAGQGGDALWLASERWNVVAVDVSATALARIEAGARAAGLIDRVSVERHDLSLSFPAGDFDLVSAAYFHTPIEIDRTAILMRAAEAVATGGALIIIEHASVAPWSWNQDATFLSPEEILGSLGLREREWSVERCEAPERLATGPQGEQAMVTDKVIAVRRRPSVS